MIGFIGLGIMGGPMAGHLLDHGEKLVVHNRTEAKATPLLERGATWASSPAELGEVDTVITMLAHPDAVRAVATGPDGFLDHLPAGTRWVDSSTVHPAFSREMAAAATDRGLRFLDAPVAGTKPQAEAADLVFFVGGDEADLASVRPLLDQMGRAVIHVGGTGMGTSIKVVVNAMLSESMAAFAENVALGRSLGLSEEALHEVLIGGPVTPPFLAMKQAGMLSDEYDLQFPMQWMHKDLRMVAAAAAEGGVHVPLAEAAADAYQEAIDAGLGGLDFSALYRHALGRVPEPG